MNTICPDCGHQIEIGEYPWCPHGFVRGGRAQSFDPVVVWQSDSDPQKFSFIGEADHPVDRGYHPIELRTLAEVDRFVTRYNAIERARMIEERDQRHSLADEGIRHRRAEFDAAKRGNLSPQAEARLRQVREWADKRREERRRKQQVDPHFHSQAFSFDAGNRPSHSSERTGWKERK